VKSVIAARIKEIGAGDPERAVYLAAHFIFDERNLTICYTGIDFPTSN
jgi:hypothetical protein